MKKIIPFLFLFIACNSANKNKEDEVSNQKEQIAEDVKLLTDFELKNNAEKIELLAIIKGIPKDSVFMIVKDYKTKIPSIASLISDNVKVENVIEEISINRHLPKKKIASILFSYNYGMLTREDFLSDHDNSSSDD